MKHDEKKIEELLDARITHCGVEIGYFDIDDLMKQYAEHMVQQVVEKIEKLREPNISILRGTEYEEQTPRTMRAIGRDNGLLEIINLINKDHG